MKMDENTWRFAQIVMWLIGIKTAVLGGIFAFLWNNLSKRMDNVEGGLAKKIDDLSNKVDRNEAKFNEKLDAKIDPIQHSLNELDKRVYGIESVLHMKDCCILKQDQNLKKAE
jgi:hypothetical protein